MDALAQTRIGNGDQSGIDLASHAVENGVETPQIDRLASDLDEVSWPPLHPQRAAFDRADVFRLKPAIDLRIFKGAIVDDPSGKKRSTAKHEPAINAFRLEMWEKNVFNGDG